MAYDDLSDQQRSFLERFLPKTKGFFGTKKKAVAERDRIADTFDSFEKRRDHLRQSIEKLPEGAQRFLLRELVKTAEQTLRGDGKTLDIDGGNAALDDVREAIRAEIARLKKASRPVPLEDEKSGIVKQAGTSLQIERMRRAQPIFDTARKELRLPATINASDAILADLDKDFAAAQGALNGYAQANLKNPALDLAAFAAGVSQIVDGFRAKVDDFEKRLARVRDEPSVKPEDQWKFYEQNKADPDVVRAVIRSDQIVDEIPTLTAAVGKLDAQIDDLKKQRANEKNLNEKKAIEQKYQATVAQREMLGDRLGQLKSYHDTADARFVEMILNREKVEAIDLASTAMSQAIGNPADPAFNGLRAIAGDPEFAPFDLAALQEANANFRKQFALSSNRIIRAERIYPNEPDVSELSDAELGALVNLLDVASGLIANGALDLATAAHQDANKLWVEFIVARKNALPPVPPVPSAPDRQLGAQLARIEAQVLDQSARGHRQAQIYINAHAELVTNVDAEAVTPQYGWDQLRREIDDLAKRVQAAMDELPVARDTPATRAAADTSAKVNKALVELYRTEKITDPSKIEDPTKDWGRAGPPKDLIPLDQVISIVNPDTGETEYQRIRTREAGGQDIDRREDKNVPRAMMDHLRSRAETLALMSLTVAEGCDDGITAFAAETEALLGAVSSKEGTANYKEIQKIIDSVDQTLKKSPLDKYIPNGLVEQKLDYEKFKKDYLTMLPVKALAAAKSQQESFAALKVRAAEIRTKYHALDPKITGIHLELSSILTESGLGVGDEIGAKMGRLFDGGALALAKKAKNLDPAVLKRITDAEAKMKAQVAAKTAGAQNLEGAWRRKLEDAWRMKEARSETAVNTADDMVGELMKEIGALHQSIDGLAQMDDGDLVKFLTGIATQMEDGANGAEENTRLQKDWDDRHKTAKDYIKLIEKSGFSKRANSDQLKGRLKGLKGRVEATASQVKKFLDRQWGIEQMDGIIVDLELLLVDVTGDPKYKKQYVSKIVVKERADSVTAMLARLADAARLAADIIDKRVKDDDTQKATYQQQILTAKKALQSVTGLPATSTLVALCTQIDARKEDTDQAAKIQRREKALAELNRLRRAVEAHPAVAVYRGNPFDNGRVYPLMMGAFHRTEVGILVSVDPRAA